LQVLDRGRKVAAVGRRCGVNESAIGLKETWRQDEGKR
jgi:hypothetical protein